jgi:hypothetical protein
VTPARRRWPKLSVLTDVTSYFILSAEVVWGPTQDTPSFLPLVADALLALPPGHTLGRVLADAAYDSEANRAGCVGFGLPAPVIALNPGRVAGHLPHARYRRQAARRFPRRAYRQRAHAESVFSAMKRTLGATLSAHDGTQQLLALWLRVLAHNIGLLVRAPPTAQQSQRTQRTQRNSLTRRQPGRRWCAENCSRIRTIRSSP